VQGRNIVLSLPVKGAFTFQGAQTRLWSSPLAKRKEQFNLHEIWKGGDAAPPHFRLPAWPVRNLEAKYSSYLKRGQGNQRYLLTRADDSSADEDGTLGNTVSLTPGSPCTLGRTQKKIIKRRKKLWRLRGGRPNGLRPGWAGIHDTKTAGGNVRGGGVPACEELTSGRGGKRPVRYSSGGRGIEAP